MNDLNENLVEDNVTEETIAEQIDAAAAEAPKVDKRHKIIRDPEGNEVKRTEYIRGLWASGNYDRSAIRDHLRDDCTSDDGSHDVAYQIVNAAVKDQAGGPSDEFLAKKAAAKEAAKAAKAAEAAEKAAATKAADEAGEEGDGEEE